jgi:hypothetical protein
LSVQCGVTCLDCGKHAPGVGDGGFLGSPSLEGAAYRFDTEAPMPTFGRLYAPLRGLGFRTYELEEFHRFLEDHEGHLLFMSSDHDDRETYPAEVKERQAQLDADYSYEEYQEAESREQERIASGEFVEALYGIACRRCRVTYATTSADRFRAFDTLPIPASAAALFLERWGPLSPDEGWNHRLMEPLDPYGAFMGHLAEFLGQHRGHPLAAVLSQTSIERATTGEDLEASKKAAEARRQARARALSIFWPRSAMFGWYMRRVLIAWSVLNALPMVVFAEVRGSAPEASPWIASPSLFAASSLLWTWVGARLAWLGLGRTAARTMGKCLLWAWRPFVASYLVWYFLSELGAKLLGLSPSWVAIADEMTWLHIFFLPTVVVIGVLEGHLQWRYFHSILAGRQAGS